VAFVYDQDGKTTMGVSFDSEMVAHDNGTVVRSEYVIWTKKKENVYIIC